MTQIRRLDHPAGRSLTHPTLLPFVLALATAALWALIENLGALLPSGYSSYQIVWVRYAVHLLFLGLIWIPRRKVSLLKTHRWKEQILRGVLMLGMPVCFILALRTLPLNTVWSIFWLAPLLAMILSSVILKEHSHKRMWIAVGIAWIAAVVVLRPHLSISLMGSVWVLGMAACFSFYLFGTRVLAKEDTLTSLFYTAAAVFVPLTALMPFVWKEMTVNAWIGMALIGLAGFGLLFALDRTLETTSIGRIAPILLSEPIWYSLLNSLLSRTPLQLQDVAAGLIILAVGSWAYFFTIHPDSQASPDSILAHKSE